MREFKHALLLTVLIISGPWSQALAQETVIYFHTDAIGSVRMITDANGQEVQRQDFTPFGEPWPANSPTNLRAFAGSERDPETRLGYLGARYYQNGTGRFMTVDPILRSDEALIDPQRWSRYTYSLNNPLRYVDPNGLDPLPAALLQFYNAAFGTDFSAVEIRTGSLANIVSKVADGSPGVTLGLDVFLAGDSGRDYQRSVEGLALVGHELTHVTQYISSHPCIGLACAPTPGFLAPYFAEYLGNRLRGQSPFEAYWNIGVEQMARLVEQRIGDFLSRNEGIFKKLQAGQPLSADELQRVRTELGMEYRR